MTTLTGAAPAAGAQLATRKEWIGLAVIALPCLLYSMDLTVLNLAIPQLSAELKPSASQMLWIIDIYGFLVAGALITMGVLGDRIGRRKLLLIGAAAFGAASIFAAFSTSAEMLIVARAVLGVAGATLAPSTLSLIRNMFHDPHQRSIAIGVWISSYSIGGALGPVFGGLLLEYFWWGSVFLVNAPIMVLLLAVGPFLLPEYRDPNPGRLDVLSALMSLVAVLAVIYGLKQLAENGVSVRPFLFMLAGAGVAYAFARRQQQLADPLIDLALFRSPTFSAALGVYMIGVLIVFGAFLFVSQYLQLVVGLRPFEAGLWMMPSGLAFIVGSTLAPRIVRRASPATVIAASLAAAAVGCALLTQIGGSYGFVALIAGFVVMSLGLAPVFTLATDIVVGAAPPARAGAASAISETSAELGGALGIALLGSFAAAIYRNAMSAAIPSALPADAAAAARGTIAGALEAAGRLPVDMGARLADQARAALTEAIVISAAVCAAIAIAAAMMALVALRGRASGASGR